MGRQQDAAYYDGIYLGSHYEQEASALRWYPIWKEVADTLIKQGATKIIDLGCGPGHLAEVIAHTTGYPIKYIGYDFSGIAIDMSTKKSLDDRFSFVKVDLSNYDFNKFIDENDNLFYVSIEFFEHVEFDQEVIKRMKPNKPLIFSLPKFDDPGHVRFFENEQSIITRYEDLLDIHEIKLMQDKWRFLIRSTVKE